MKYIMLRMTANTGVIKLVPVIFPDFISHEGIGKSVVEILKRENKAKDIKIESAGDCEILVEDCSGESITLNVEHNENDANIINQYDWMHGIGYR